MKILGRLLPFRIVALYAIACSVSGRPFRKPCVQWLFSLYFPKFYLARARLIFKIWLQFSSFLVKGFACTEISQNSISAGFLLAFPKQSDDPGVLEDTEENLGEFLDLKLYVYFFRITCVQSTLVVR